MHARRTVLGAAMLALAAAMAPVAVARADTVKVGVLLSLSGPAAPFGIPERNIIQILADQFNAKGGANGHTVQLLFHDDQSSPTEAARGAMQLIRQDDVQVILGPATGSSTLAMAPIAAQAKVPVLAPVSTQSVTDRDHGFFPWVFRTSPASAVTMQAMMRRAVFRPGIRKVAIMYQEDAYGKDEAELAQRLIKAHGGIDIVAMASAPLTATDLSAAATRIRNADPDIVLLLTSAPGMGGAFVRGAELAQLKAPILGSLSLNQRPFIDAAGKAGEGVMSVSLGNADDPSPKQQALLKALLDNGKQPAGYSDIIGSTAFLALAEVLGRIKGPVTGQEIRDQLEHLCGFNGTFADGPLCYSKDQHDGFGPETVNVVRIVGGKWQNVAP